jgi:hypothetical protein
LTRAKTRHRGELALAVEEVVPVQLGGRVDAELCARVVDNVADCARRFVDAGVLDEQCCYPVLGAVERLVDVGEPHRGRRYEPVGRVAPR